LKLLLGTFLLAYDIGLGLVSHNERKAGNRMVHTVVSAGKTAQYNLRQPRRFGFTTTRWSIKRCHFYFFE